MKFAMSEDRCCHRHQISAPSTCQTLDELAFERGIWSSALNGETEKLETQLNSGTDPSICDSSGYTALHYAARNGKKDACSFLLVRGANANAQTPGGATPLLRAAFQGHLDIINLLLSHKADPFIRDSDGKTPLHKAAERQHQDVAKALVAYKPDLKNIRDNRGHLPVFYANKECKELVNMLSVQN